MKAALHSLIRTAKWLVRDVPKAPGFEFYMARQDSLNRAELARQRQNGPARADDWLLDFKAQPIPKIIWVFWAQGEAEAPHVVRRCLDRMRALNPGWDVRILSDQNVAQYVDMSDAKDWFPHRYQANLLRLRLLAVHGGVWMDATTWCHRPLDDWLPMLAASGFFCFDNPGPDRIWASWFLAAAPGNPILAAWAKAYGDDLQTRGGVARAYFLAFYRAQWALRRDPALQKLYARKAGYPAPRTFLMMSALLGRTEPGLVRDAIGLGLPVSKLSWKTGLLDAEFDAKLAELDPERA